MRKAGKKRIAQAIKEYQAWRAKVDARLEGIDPQGAAIAREWADDVLARIQEGELPLPGSCLSALSRSVVRVIEDFESGFYKGVTSTGGFILS
jgi:hypothetical protein